MKICKNCTLNDSILSVRINDGGLCNYCLQSNISNNSISVEEYAKHEKNLMEVLDKYKNLPYQILLAYSGGKDSTYTLYKLREKFNVSVLAVTFDNGFLTEECRKNIHCVTANLGVDSMTIKPSFSKLAKVFNLAASREIYPKKALERASSICTACIGIIKSTVYKEAILRKIPFVCFGWTPGQARVKDPVMKLDYRMILANQKQISEPIVKYLGDEYKKYFIDPKWLEAQCECIPSLAYPLVFSNYNEDEMLNTIKNIGWIKPYDTDMNSTNCLLNSYANYIHERDYGYNPYSLEIANLVREGFMTREEGFKKLAKPGKDSIINYVKNELDKYSKL